MSPTEYQADYYQRNKERIAVSRREWRQKNAATLNPRNAARKRERRAAEARAARVADIEAIVKRWTWEYPNAEAGSEHAFAERYVAAQQGESP